MSKIKFEECFLKNIKEFISVENLKQIYERQDQSYKNDYYNNFYCLECRNAKLSFHPNASTPHFRSNGYHDEGCSFNFNPINRDEYKEFSSDSNNYVKIQKKLNSCLDLLNRCNQKPNIDEYHTSKDEEKEKNYRFTIKHKSNIRSIRRKKLINAFNLEDYKIPMIFYGTVLVE